MANPWERDWSQSGEGVYIPPNPTKQRGVSAEVGSKESEARVDQATEQDQIRKAAADASKAEAEARNAALQSQLNQMQIDLETATGGMTAKDAAERRAKQGQLSAFVEQINRVQDLLNNSTNRTTGLAGVMDYLPSAQGAAVDAAAAGLAEQGMAAFRVPGIGAQSDTELRQFVEANKPSRSSFDSANSERLRQLRNRAEQALRSSGLPVPEWTPEIRGGQVQQSPPADLGQGMAAQPQPETELRSDGAWAADPALAGLNSRVNQMIRERRPESEIRAYIDSVRPNMGNAAVGIQENIDYLRNNPTYNPAVDLENVWTPSTGVSAALGSIADSPVGAGVISAANAATAGNLGRLAGGDADLILAALEENRPISSFVGDVAGTLAPASLLGKVGALGRFGGVGADMLYGGVRGASEADDDAILSGIAGAGTALGGNLAGRALGNVVGGAVGGVGSDQARLLADRGVRMTPGQIVGDSGIVGRGIRGMEDAASSIPFLGAAVSNRRRLGLEDYNRAQVAENLSPIGFTPSPNATGPSLMAEANQAVDDAYGFLDGRSIAGDQQYINDVAGALSRSSGIAGAGDQVSTLAHQGIAPLFNNGVISGPNLRSAISDLRGARTNMASGNTMENMASKEVGALESALLDLANRQAPDVAEGMNVANNAYKSLAPLREASIGAVNEGGLFTPAQAGRKSVQGTRRFGGNAAASEGRYGGYDLQQAAQDVLPSTIPNSGTADRAIANAVLPASLAGGGALGATVLDPTTAILMSVLGASYSPAGQNAIQAALTKRPEAARAAGQYIMDWRDLLGHAGAAATTAGIY